MDDVANAHLNPDTVTDQKLDIDITAAKWRARQHGTVDQTYRALVATKRMLIETVGFSAEAIESAMKAEADKLWEEAREAYGKPGSGPEAPAA